MKENINTKHFDKFDSALSAKAIPAFQVEDVDSKIIYSFLGMLNSEAIKEILKCYLLQGFNKLYKDLETQLASNSLDSSDAKKIVDDRSKELKKKIYKYTCEYSSTNKHIPTIDDLEKYPTLVATDGITNDNISEIVRKLNENILRYAETVKERIELYNAKNPLDRKLYIKKSITSDKVADLYKQLTLEGKEVIRCSLYDFEQFLRGNYTSGRLEFSKKASIVTLINCLKDYQWLDPNCKNYWQYVSNHVIGFDKKTTWTSKSLLKNPVQSQTPIVNDFFNPTEKKAP